MYSGAELIVQREDETRAWAVLIVMKGGHTEAINSEGLQWTHLILNYKPIIGKKSQDSWVP